MLKIVAFLAVIGLGGLFAFDRLERELVYPFDATRVDPADMGLALREERFASGTETLILWVAAPKPGKPVILYFHGNAGNLAARAGRFARFLERGYGVVAMGYRGSSGSTGSPSEKKLAFDAGRLLNRIGEYAEGPVVIYGESLGSAVALAAIERAGVQPAGLILEAPFTTVRAVALNAYPQLEPLIDRMKSRWNSVQRIRGVSARLLIVHGTEDALIPIDMGRAALRQRPVRKQTIPGGQRRASYRPVAVGRVAPAVALC